VLGIQIALFVAMSVAFATCATKRTGDSSRACRRSDTAAGLLYYPVPAERRRTRRGRRTPGALPAEWLSHVHPANTTLRRPAR
jgi:hypothetical protein